MKTKLLYLFSFMGLFIIFINLPLKAQISSSEGTNFWVAFPYLISDGLNTPRSTESNSIFQLFINSKTKNTLQIYDSKGLLIISNIIVNANEDKIIAIPLNYMVDQSETTQNNNSIRVVSEKPISVTAHVGSNAYFESYSIIPSNNLGYNYYTANLYQDYYKNTYNKFIQSPGQIILLATEDNTNITYSPKAKTRLVETGQSRTINLNKGETYLILADTLKSLTHNYISDLTGTYISANKKIAVFSGHCRVSFPAYGSTIYSTLQFAYPRNLMIEQMLPVDLLGTTNITVPFAFEKNRTYLNKTSYEKGDLIRIIATQDNTELYIYSKYTGQKEVIKDDMKAGEIYENAEQQEPEVYYSSKPVAVFQYAKTYFNLWPWGYKINPEVESDKDDNDLQYGTRGSTGMLIRVTPNERWVNYCSFTSLQNLIPQYFTMVFRKGTDSLIKFDNQLLTYKFSTEIKNIPFSDYSYIAFTSLSGVHIVESINEDIKFTVYAYGYLIGTEKGTSHGFTPGMDYSEHCVDTLLMSYTQPKHNEFTGTVNAIDLYDGKSCSAVNYIKNIDSLSKNAILDYKINSNSKSWDFNISFPDEFADGNLKFIAKSSGGSTIDTNFTYDAPDLELNLRRLDYFIENTNIDYTKSIAIKNTGANELKITIPDINSKNNSFKIANQDKNIILPAGAEYTINIIARFLEPSTLADTAEMYIDINDISYKAVNLYASNNSIVIISENVDWENVPYLIKIPQMKYFTVLNSTSQQIKIKKVGFLKNKGNFAFDDLNISNSILDATNDNNFTLNSGDSTIFGVKYTPDNFTNTLDIDSIEIQLSTDKNIKVELKGSINKSKLIVTPIDYLELPYYKLDSLHFTKLSITNNSYLPFGINLKKGTITNFAGIVNNKNNALITINKNSTIDIDLEYKVSSSSIDDVVDSLIISYRNNEFIYNLTAIKFINRISNNIIENLNIHLPKEYYTLNEFIIFDFDKNIISKIEIYNEKGQLIKDGTFNSNISIFNSSDFIPGRYFYKVLIKDQEIKGKFIVK